MSKERKLVKKSRSRRAEGAKVTRSHAIQNRPFSLTGGFPDRSRVRLKYVSKIALSGINQTQVWSGNSCFDPDVTNTGAQPYNYDDWAVQYNRYRCYGSSIKAWFVASSATYPTTQFDVLIGPRHTTTSVVSSNSVFNDAWASPYMTMRSESQLNAGYSPVNNSAKKSMSLSKFLGLSQSEMMSDQYQALVSASPAHQWYWHTSFLAMDAASTVTGFLHVELVYDVEFFDRLEQTIDQQSERIALLKQNFANRKETKVAGSEKTEEKNNLTSALSEDEDLVLVKKSMLSNKGYLALTQGTPSNSSKLSLKT